MRFRNSFGIIPRKETRVERYNTKLKNAKTIPVSLATINFEKEGNLGFLIRSAACFGVKNIYCIGQIPARSKLQSYSGSLIDYVNLIQLSTPHDLIEHCRSNNLKLVAAELCDDAVNLFDYSFSPTLEYVIVVGSEEIGVPAEILHHADNVYIEMKGVGFCLNTAQTGNIMLAEYSRQQHKANNE